MSSWNDVRTAGRFAQWEVVLGPSVHCKTSNPFAMGAWSWQLSVQRDYAHTHVSLLSPAPPPPVAGGMGRVASVSFQSLHHCHDSRSAVVAREVELDRGSNRGLVWTMPNFVSASFVINFIDVKLRNDDGSSTSLWPSNPINQVVQTSAQSGFASMLRDGIFSDILVNAAGCSIKAHRAVLAARSPVLMRIISDMSLEACRAFISYIYGSITEEEFLAHRSELLSAGDKYDIVELKNLCENSMIEDVDNGNVLDRLQMAHLYGLSMLKKTCMWLLVEFLKIYDTPEDFHEFVQTGDPDLVAEVLESCRGQGYRLRRWLQCQYPDLIQPVLKKEGLIH